MEINRLKDWEINELYLKYGPTLSPPVILNPEVSKPIPPTQPKVSKPKTSPRKLYRGRVNHSMPLPAKEGYHRDHIIPVALGFELGLSVEQINHIDNLQYTLPHNNESKFSFITEEVKQHLNKMCPVWGIPTPNDNIIDTFNKTQEKYSKYFKK